MVEVSLVFMLCVAHERKGVSLAGTRTLRLEQCKCRSQTMPHAKEGNHIKHSAGSTLVHDGGYVHGVTQLVRGVRYGLYVLRWDDTA